jgi:NitT/TauT family transport system substrate-binding protein
MLALLLVTAAAALAACGGGEDESSESQGGSTKPKETVTIAVAAATPVFAYPYIAQQLGYFEKAGVDVKLIPNSGANTLNQVASGQADLGMIAAGVPLLLAQQGKDSKIIYSPQGGAAGGMLVGGADVKRVEDIRGKRIGTLSRGSSMYGFGVLYNRKFKLDADVVPLQNNASIAGALKSGRIAAATGPFDAYAAQIEAGEATVLVDTRDKAEREKILGPDFPEGAVFGLAPNLEKKRDAIVAVMKAYDDALEYMRGEDPAKIAETLRKSPDFQAIPPDKLAEFVDSAKSYIGLEDGAISPAVWQHALDQYALWGLGDFDPKNPLFSYDKRIDMSYLEAARGDGGSDG